MKRKLFFIASAVVLLGVSIGMFLYATSQNSTSFTDSQSSGRETVFKLITYEPTPCVAYAYKIPFGGTDENQGAAYTYHVSIYLPENAILIESREGELMDCTECVYRCSAYYELCDEYGVEYY